MLWKGSLFDRCFIFKLRQHNGSERSTETGAILAARSPTNIPPPHTVCQNQERAAITKNGGLSLRPTARILPGVAVIVNQPRQVPCPRPCSPHVCCSRCASAYMSCGGDMGSVPPHHQPVVVDTAAARERSAFLAVWNTVGSTHASLAML